MATVWSWKKGFYDTFEVRNKTSDSLYHAAVIGDKEMICYMINRDININEKDDLGWTAFMFSAFNHQIGAMKLLMEAKADINAVNNKGETALILSVKTEHRHIMPWTRADQIEAVKLLVDNKADLSIKDNEGLTALKWARNNRLIKILKILMEVGTE